MSMADDLLQAAADLVTAGASMQEPEFYDMAMTGEGEPAMLPWEASPWRETYEEAARWVGMDDHVLDLGCGTGRFLGMLAAKGYRGLLQGMDFSPLAVKEAKRYLGDYFPDSIDFAHRVKLDVQDLRGYTPPKADTYVCLEVLEHLADDLEVVASLPPGSRFIFSVPSYMSASHVRAFPLVSQVFTRFEPLLDIRRWRKHQWSPGMLIHVCDSHRRAGGW